MKYLTSVALLLLFMGTSCCTSSKSSQSNKAEDSSAMNETSMMEAGFTLGTIVASQEENDCPYVIKSEVAGNTVMYDPINLGDEYKKDGIKVWYKYDGLRRMNRCDKASPISISEIQKM